MSFHVSWTFGGVTVLDLTILGDTDDGEADAPGEALHDSTAAGHISPQPAVDYDTEAFIRPRR